MADLGNALAEFERQVTVAEGVVSSVEALWQLAPTNSDVRRRIGSGQLGALYEMAYLSIFGHWENFVEDCLARMIAGQGCPGYQPVLTARPKVRTLKAARQRVLGGNKYLLWYDPQKCAARIAGHVAGSPLEGAIVGAQVNLEHYAAVRHAIAHRSNDSFDQFVEASKQLCGVAEKSPGEFLRRQDHSDPLNPVRWIRKISADLRSLAAAAVA